MILAAALARGSNRQRHPHGSGRLSRPTCPAQRLPAVLAHIPPRGGVPLHDVQEAASHADPRTTMRYDRARTSLDRHATYIVAT